LFYPLNVLALVSSRTLNRMFRRRIRANRVAARRVLIVGCGVTGQRIARALAEKPGYYNLVGFVDDDRNKRHGALPEVPFLGTTEDLERALRDHAIDEVIVAIPSAAPERIMDLIGECLRLKVKWKVVPNLCNVMLDRMHIDHIGGLPLISLRGSRIVGFNWAFKRSFDLTFASLVLIVLAPINLLMALLVKLTSSGPVLFKQTRIGLNGKPFTFLKFRSMCVANNTDAHRSFAAEWIYGRTGGTALSAEQPNGAAPAIEVGQKTHKLTNDQRITPLGRLLRSTSLDELPQFWNVIRGEMSVVGPRPPVPYEVERYTEWHKRRLEVLPGITGLWQVNGRNSLSFKEMVRLDINYIESWSMAQDIRIVLKTVPAILFNRGH
jgi:exopolysaccharide biosynthesis polyprenyl glycosylphosphotransferase